MSAATRKRSSTARNSLAGVSLWLVAIGLLAFMIAWPLSAGMAAANDDLKFIRGEQYAGTLADDLAEGWQRAANFRPLENLAALLCDEQSLECRAVMLVQVAGLAAMAVAAGLLLKRLIPQSRAALPLLLIWLALSPATTISLWQMDTCSQTWSAAAGLWLGWLTWRGIDAARSGDRALWPHLLLLSAFTLASVNIKEMMYGWSAGIGAAVFIACIAALRQGERRGAQRVAWLLVPIVALPIAHLLYRLQFAGLGAVAEAGGSSEARYSVALGANLLKNMWISLLGMFSNGPLHLVMDTDAPILLRLLPLLSLLCVFLVIAMAWALWFLYRTPPAGARVGAAVLCAIAGLLSVSVTLPMGTVSELYGMGANAASGLLVVVGLLTLWSPARVEEQRLSRTVAGFCAAAILAVGGYGLISRAYHFHITWQCARQLNQTLLAHQARLEPSPQPAVIYFGRPCTTGHMWNQYVLPPVLAIGPEYTMPWMNRRDPLRRVAMSVQPPLGQPRERDLVLDCADLPPRARR